MAADTAPPADSPHTGATNLAGSPSRASKLEHSTGAGHTSHASQASLALAATFLQTCCSGLSSRIVLTIAYVTGTGVDEATYQSCINVCQQTVASHPWSAHARGRQEVSVRRSIPDARIQHIRTKGGLSSTHVPLQARRVKPGGLIAALLLFSR